MLKFFKKKPIKVEEIKHNQQLENISKNYREKKLNFSAKEMLKIYNVTKPKNRFDIKGHKFRFISKYFPLSTFLINMQLTNGRRMQFIIRVKDGGFRFDNGFYIVDDEMRYYNATANMWCLDYHEELCFPLDLRVNINKVKSDLIKSSLVELKTAINPQSLQAFMESNIIQKLLAGASLDDSMKFMKMMIIINTIGIGINVILTFASIGVFGGG